MSEKDAYRKLWSGDITCEPYLQWLARGDEGLWAGEPFVLTVLDVTLSGDLTDYELRAPIGDMSRKDFYLTDELQLWLQVTKQQLSAFKSDVGTRIVVFSRESGLTVRNLLGTKYNIRPEFFADIQHQEWLTSQTSTGALMGTGTLRWAGAYQAFNYATGTSARHLKFENGFVACVLEDCTSDAGEKKNVGRCRTRARMNRQLMRQSWSVRCQTLSSQRP